MNIILRRNDIFKFLPQIVNCNTQRSLAFKSSVSLDSLYPSSDLKLVTPSKTLKEDKQFSGYIPINELDITYSRSPGPGGQNVNKVNTKVDLRFNVESASWINSEVKTKLMEKYKTKITKDGFLVFRSDLTRSQQLNLANCLEKLRTAIRNLSVPEAEISKETLEKIRKRHERACQGRLNIKRQRSQIKADRRTSMI